MQKPEYIDYSGKLNNHIDYLNMLKLLDKKCNYIEIVLIDGKETNDLVNQFQSDILNISKVNSWCGNMTNGYNKKIKINYSNELFKYLKTKETFCKFATLPEKGDVVNFTDFGLDDIAFFDESTFPLLFTTTHEGYIYVRDDILY